MSKFESDRVVEVRSVRAGKPRAGRGYLLASAAGMVVSAMLAADAGAQTKIYGNSGSLSAGTSWSPSGTPTSANETLFTGVGSAGGLITTASGTNLNFGNVIWNATGDSTTIALSNTATTNTTLTLSSSGTLTPSGSAEAILAGGAEGDLIVMGSQATGTLRFASQLGTGTAAFRLALGNTGNFNVVNAGATLELASTLSGGFTLNKTGAGRMLITNSAPSTGMLSGVTRLNINGGMVEVASHTNAFGTSTTTGTPISVNNGAILRLTSTALSFPSLTLNNGATLQASGGTSSYGKNNFPTLGATGSITLSTIASTDLLNITQPVRGGDVNSVITVNGPGQVKISAGSAGATAYAGSWNVNGAGTNFRITDVDGLGNPGGLGRGKITLTQGIFEIGIGNSGTNVLTGGITVVGDSQITPDRGATGDSNTHNLNSLTIGTNSLRIGKGSNYTNNAMGSVAFSSLNLVGNPTFQVDNTKGTFVGSMTVGPVSDGGVARTITKNGPANLIFASGLNLTPGTSLVVNGGTVTASGVVSANVSLADATMLRLNDGASVAAAATTTLTGSVQLDVPSGAASVDGPVGGAGGIVKTGAGNATLTGAINLTGAVPVTASAGNLIVQSPLRPVTGSLVVTGPGASIKLAAPASVSSIVVAAEVASVTVAAGGSVQLTTTDRAAAKQRLLLVGGIGGAGTLDLTNNDMIVRGGALADVRAAVSNWYSGATDVLKISSSTAGGSGLDALATLAVVSNGTGYYASFDGVAVSSSDVLVKYTYLGDTNLDGVVNGSDLVNALEGYSNGLTGWENGDTDYNGIVNEADVQRVLASLNGQVGSFGNSGVASGNSGSGAVPEPAAASLLIVPALAAGRRQRRSQ